jgi:N-acetylneuraminate epimerase
MKNTVLYLTFLLTSILSPELLAQNQHVQNIDWSIAAQIPPADQQTKSIGLAGAISGTDHHILLVAGGTNFPGEMPWNGGKKKYYNDVFIYLKTTKDLLLIPAKKTSKLPFNLAYSAVCSTSHGIVVAGGENENGLSKKVLILNWKANELHIDYLPDLPNALSNAALTVVGDVVYLAGGEVENGATDQFLSLDLANQQNGWKKMTHLPHPVSHTVLLTAESGKEIFLIGGRKRNPGDTSTRYKNVSAFDVEKEIWTEKQSLPYTLSAATGIAIGKDFFMISGDLGETFHQAEKLIAEIDREKDPVKKERLNQQKIKVQANHPGFSRSVLKYDSARNTWSTLKGLLPYGTVTTNAVILDHEIIIAGGEIKAGVRTPNILRGQLKSNK